MRVLVTGGAGFIGSALVRYLITQPHFQVLNVDKLTYAGNLTSLASVTDVNSYQFRQLDILDSTQLTDVFASFRPTAILHLAAETHVDRSISGAENFIQSNIVGTFNLLEVSLQYWRNLSQEEQQVFRFLHVSTDEVYGDLAIGAPPFTETSQYAPSSPYSASKAASDHLVRAWHRTYGLPVMLSHCSNNYGPYQYPEKLIPLILINALSGKPLPVYGDGQQIRDWLFVEDHVQALFAILQRGRIGQTYHIGGHNEVKNQDVVHAICALLEELAPEKPAGISYYRDLISHVDDRLGHDRRYAMNANKIADELQWLPKESFASGLRKTVQWYLANPEWWGHCVV